MTAEQTQKYQGMAYDKVYVINLARSTERLNRTDSLLNELGIPYDRFEAVDGYKISVVHMPTGNTYSATKLKEENLPIGDQYKIICNPENPNPVYFFYQVKELLPQLLLSPGEFGIYCTHRMIHNDIKNKGYKNALVFEDDILITDINYNSHLNQFIQHLPSTYHTAYLSITTDQKNTTTGITTNNFPIIDNPYVNQFSNKNSYFWGIYAMIYSNKAAIILSEMWHFHSQLDYFLLDLSTNIFNDLDKPLFETYITPQDLQILVGTTLLDSTINDMGRCDTNTTNQ